MFGFFKKKRKNIQQVSQGNSQKMQQQYPQMPTASVGVSRYQGRDIMPLPVQQQYIPQQSTSQMPQSVVLQQVQKATAQDFSIENEEDAVKKFSKGMVDIKDIISPPAIEVDFNH